MYRSTKPAVKLTLENNNFVVDFGQLFEISDSGIETYRGAYSVEPDFTEQTLCTKNKKMLNDVTVNAIEVQRVSNTSGAAIVGNVSFATVYTGNGAPDASLGSDGDFYFDMG